MPETSLRGPCAAHPRPLHSEVGAERSHALHGGDAIGVQQLACEVAARESDLETTAAFAQGFDEGTLGRRCHKGIAEIGAGNRVERYRSVAHGTRDHMLGQQASEAVAEIGTSGLRPRVGFKPTRPQHDAGSRIDPPPSLAWGSGTMPAAP